MSDTISVEENYIRHKKFKKFAWRSIVTSSQDNMVPTAESNSIPNIDISVKSEIAEDSDLANDRILPTETRSEMMSQQPAEAPLDFSVRNSKNTKKSQKEAESRQNAKFVSDEPKIYYTENFPTPNKTLNNNSNGNSPPIPLNGRVELPSPNHSPVNGFPATYNSNTQLHNSPTHLQNGRKMQSVATGYKAENGHINHTISPEQFNMYQSIKEHSRLLKMSADNGKEVNGVNFHGDPSSSPSRSSSASLESSPPRQSTSILEEALAGKSVERSQIHGMYPSMQNSPHESNTRLPQIAHPTPNSIGLNAELPRNGMDLNAAYASQALRFPGAVSPLGLSDVSANMQRLNPLIPVVNPLIPGANFPLHNALVQGTLNGMNPFAMSSLNSRLSQTSSEGDRKTGKPYRPFKALAPDLLMGMAHRIPVSPALSPSLPLASSFTNTSNDSPKSNSAPKKEVPRELENGAASSPSNKEAEPVAPTSSDSNGSRNGENGYHTEIADASINRKRSRLPEDQKDAAYYERRRKNNEAAKRSRDARRAKEDMITQAAYAWRQENMNLALSLQRLQEEHAKALLKLQSLTEDNQKMEVQMRVLNAEVLAMACWNCGSRYSDGLKKRSLE